MLPIAGYLIGLKNQQRVLTDQGVSLKDCENMLLTVSEKLEINKETAKHLIRLQGCKDIDLDFSRVEGERYGLKLSAYSDVAIKIENGSKNIKLSGFEIAGGYSGEPDDNKFPPGCMIKNNYKEGEEPIVVDYYIVSQFWIHDVGKEGIYCNTSGDVFGRTRLVIFENFCIERTGWDGCPQNKNTDLTIVRNFLCLDMGLSKGKKSQNYGFMLERNRIVEISNFLIKDGSHKALHSKGYIAETVEDSIFSQVICDNGTFIDFDKGFYLNRSVITFRRGTRIKNIAQDLFEEFEGVVVIEQGGLILDNNLRDQFESYTGSVIGTPIYENVVDPEIGKMDNGESCLMGFYKELGQGQLTN